MRTRRCLLAIFVMGFVVQIAPHAGAQPANSGAVSRRLIPWQGYLTRPDPGNPKEYKPVLDGRYSILFTLYSAPTGASSMVWGPERHEGVVVVNGLVNVLLGSVNALPDSPAGFFGRPLYVGITVDADNDPQKPNVELVPRQVLLPSLYAYEARNAAFLEGHKWSEVGKLQTSVEGLGTQLHNLINRVDVVVPGVLSCKELQIDGRKVMKELDRKDDLPVGTVVASVFPWLVWRTQFPDAGGRWVPADGREVVATSAYARMALQAFVGENPPPELIHQSEAGGKLVVSVPDLRGVFLRGLNQNDPDREAAKLARSDLDDKRRKPGDFQADQVVSHTHSNPIADHHSKAGTGSNSRGYWSDTENARTIASTGQSPDGGKETRPRNVSVYYYIKIE